MIFKKMRAEKFNYHIETATSLMSASNFQEAIPELEKAIKINSNSSDAWRKLGLSYDAFADTKLTKEKWDEAGILKNKAIDCLRESIKIEPNSAETYAWLGNVLWDIDFRKSSKEYEKALSLKPDNKSYIESVDRLKLLINENTYTLNNLKIILLNSIREEPHPDIYKEKFYWENTKISSGVIYECYSGTETQKAGAWLFDSDKPDLRKERPVTLVFFMFPFLRTDMQCHVSVESRCPSNYDAIVQILYKEGVI